MTLDHQAIKRLKAHDNPTFEKIYDETKRGVYAIVFSVTKSHEDTNDLLQDVYMKMLIKIDQYKVGSNFLNWLLQIAKNHAIDYYRREKKVTRVDEDQIHHIQSNYDENPDESDQFQRMIEALDEDERMIVLLKIVDDLTHQEIAKITQKPLGTVLWIYQKAINKLKRFGGDVHE
ncbi:MAG: RNA polymerase sigma factor [Acholeplasma sp.]|jgi:RNA polymerase sigma-70 factor (ECF subfamily)|nr:MAG: RNA polymerase sigma factor [Acholeplasma sp.]